VYNNIKAERICRGLAIAERVLLVRGAYRDSPVYQPPFRRIRQDPPTGSAQEMARRTPTLYGTEVYASEQIISAADMI